MYVFGLFEFTLSLFLSLFFFPPDFYGKYKFFALQKLNW